MLYLKYLPSFVIRDLEPIALYLYQLRKQNIILYINMNDKVFSSTSIKTSFSVTFATSARSQFSIFVCELSYLLSIRCRNIVVYCIFIL